MEPLMTLITASNSPETLNDKSSARLISLTQWSGRRARKILPGLCFTSIVASASFGNRRLPGTTNFSPLILSMVIGIAYHNIVGTAAWAKQGVTFSLRRLLRLAIILLGLQLTASQVIEIGGRGLGIIAASVLATFAFTIWTGKWLGVAPKLPPLIAAGTSICGPSAAISANTVTA